MFDNEDYYLTRRSPTKRKITTPAIAFDVENWKDGRLRYMHFFGERLRPNRTKRYKEDRGFTNGKKAMDFIRSISTAGRSDEDRVPFVLVGHNVKYDRWFFEDILDDSTVLINKSGYFITGETKNGIEIVDTFQIGRGSLLSWIENLKMKEQWGIEKTTTEDFESASDEWTQYHCKNDAMATWRLYEYLISFMNEQKIPFSYTTAGMGLNILKLHFSKGDGTKLRFHRAKEFDFISQFERQAYHGGRVEVFFNKPVICSCYDVNSMYPHVMEHNLYPDPGGAKTIATAGKARSWEQMLEDVRAGAIFDCVVRVPEDKFPVCAPLPYHTKEGRMIFPTGEFRGSFCKPELQMALNRGCEIIEMIQYTKYKKMHTCFRDFARYIWALRTDYPKYHPMERMGKLLSNSPYGKLGEQVPDDDQYYIGKLRDCKLDLDEKNVIPCLGFAGMPEEYIIVRGKKKKDARHTFPVLAAYVTTYARVKLFLEMLRHQDHLIYVDTDCMHLGEGCKIKVKVGDGLGEWKYEDDKSGNIHHFAPKTYYDIDRKKWVSKGKPVNSKLEQREDGLYAIFESPVGIHEAIKRNVHPCSWETKHRRIPDKDNKRVWNSDGTSKPIRIIDREGPSDD